MLGFVWVMLNPLLMMLILNIVFLGLFKVSTNNYTAYLISGIILWNFFSQSTSASMPKAIFPISIVISAVINLLFSLVPLFIIFLITGTSVSRFFYLVPAVIFLVALLSFGVSLLLSTLTVFFHDMKYIYEVLLLAWMYMTPIFYPESIISKEFASLFHLNPFYYFMDIFRSSL